MKTIIVSILFCSTAAFAAGKRGPESTAQLATAKTPAMALRWARSDLRAANAQASKFNIGGLVNTQMLKSKDAAAIHKTAQGIWAALEAGEANGAE